MVTIKSKKEIESLREGGRRLARVLDEIALAVQPGISAFKLDVLAERLVRRGGDIPSFLNYKPYGAEKPYPSSLCVSVNDEVVHGPPLERKVLKDGDIVSLDMGLVHDGLFVDSAVTVPVGAIDKTAQNLLAVTREALKRGIREARAGKFTGDIGHAVESFIKPKGLGIVRELAGHGVGYGVHEDPYVPNYGKPGKGVELKSGMVIAVEPMINEGTSKIVLDKDGFTFRTADGKRSAHFEHTVLITDGEPEILTK